MTNEPKSSAAAPRGGRSERSGDLPPRGAAADPEVAARAKRRRFDAAYKARIVAEADACRDSGGIGALLRREGLYSSHLAEWRGNLRRNGEAGLGRKRGPTAKPKPSAREVELERENKKLAKRLAKAEAIIAFQKKAHELLGLPLNHHGLDEDE